MGIRKSAREYIRANHSSGKFPYGVLMEKLSAALQILPCLPRNPSSGIPEIISGAGEGI
jgi:hypothetical protein